jgi:predicted ferric reductase
LQRVLITLVWAACAALIALAGWFAASSELQAWREPIYIAAGFAGVAALALMLFQPLLAAGLVPVGSKLRARRIHRLVGITLVLAVVLHVAGLWITSPPDVIDALLFVSATPFSIWGVLAMWSIFIAAGLVTVRRKFAPRHWRFVHKALALITVSGTAAHALMIEGTMEYWSKAALCVLLLLTTVWVFVSLRARG